MFSHQQDASEFFLALLNLVREEAKRALENVDTQVICYRNHYQLGFSEFAFETTKEMECCACGEKWSSPNNVAFTNMLELDVRVSDEPVLLVEMIKNYFAIEAAEMVSCSECSSMETKQKIKCTRILGKTLVFSVKRFRFDGYNCKKVTTKIIFPQTISLSKCDIALSEEEGVPFHAMIREFSNLNDQFCTISPDHSPNIGQVLEEYYKDYHERKWSHYSYAQFINQFGAGEFQLSAIIRHHGSALSGHYTCDIYQDIGAGGKEWIRHNDDRVHQVTLVSDLGH